MGDEVKMGTSKPAVALKPVINKETLKPAEATALPNTTQIRKPETDTYKSPSVQQEQTEQPGPVQQFLGNLGAKIDRLLGTKPQQNQTTEELEKSIRESLMKEGLKHSADLAKPA